MISVVINNYNYGRFIGAAVESALAQTAPDVEVIAVDDGSTDDSASVLAAYADRVKIIRKENGGQASALNAGFAASRGEWVLFLDSDDFLDPNAVETALACSGDRDSTGEVVNVQFLLRQVDAEGEALKPPATMPPALCREDPLQRLLGQGAYKFAPTSGNLYKRSALERFFPIPDEAVWRVCADAYVQTCIPFYGRIVFYERELGSYRVHGSNLHCVAEKGKTLESTAQSLYYRWRKAEVLRRQAAANGLEVNDDAEYINYPPVFWEWVCRRLYQGTRYHFPPISRGTVLRKMLRTFGDGRAKFGPMQKTHFLGLTILAMFAPKAVVRRLAGKRV